MGNIFSDAAPSGHEFANGFASPAPRLPGMDTITQAFTRHPRSVGESYWEHMAMALSFAAALFVGALACLAHALFPFVCERTGSSIVRRLHERLSARGAPPTA
jgi:hypothetical protein